MANTTENPAGFTAEPELQAKLDSLDDNLEPINEKETSDDKSQAEDKEPAEEKDETAAEEQETEQEEGADDTSEESDESSDEESDGYTIDEGDEEEEDVPSNSTQETPATGTLTPEQQYIFDNVKPIKVRGYVGDSEKIESFEILAPEQLPDGFRFVDDKERTLAVNGLTQLENRALELQNEYRNQESVKSAKEFQAREDAADRQDIGELQRAGELPKFKTDPDSKDFENDPAVQLVQEILDYKEKRNNQYMEEYNAGRPYKHIGFEEAYRMYKAANPDKSADALKQEDAERKNLANRTTKNRGANVDTSSNKPKVTSGMTSRDLDNLIENLDW